MRIGLIDVDGHNFPNLALMKISAYHKNKGNKVEFVDLFKRYDKVYQSKVFTFTDDFEYLINAKEITKGGTGYDLQNTLPAEIENMFPDYNLYDNPKFKNTAYGFLTRGCPRGCLFCIVAEKEGRKSYKVANLDNFWNGQKHIKLLDPNLFGSKDRIDLLNQLIESKAWVDFTQGVDARLLDEAITDKLQQIKVKMLHFAWDMMEQSDLIVKNLKQFKETTGMDMRKLRVYVLTNFNTTEEEDLYRIYRLKELGYDPYVMIYEKWNASKRLKRIARWVNNKFIFRKCEKFEDYIA